MNFLLLTLIPGVITFFVMKKEKEKVGEGQIDNSPLTGKLLLYVIILTLFGLIFAQAVFYYGWKKQLPEKAKRANNIGWLIYLGIIAVVIFLGN